MVKFSFRKNVPGGCVLRMPCFCNLGKARASSMCPVHIIRAAIRRRVPPAQLLFRSVNRGNFNRALNAAMAKLLAPEAHRFGPHGFRRGTAQDLMESGSPWAVVAAAGIWNSQDFWGYLDMSRDAEEGAMRLFDFDVDSDSDADQVPWVGAFRPSTGLPRPHIPWVSGLSRSGPSGCLPAWLVPAS